MLAMRDDQFNRMALNESRRTGFTQDQGGKWYFYNQAAKGFGQPEFRMKWGSRKLEDNWRRSNKSETRFETGEETEASDTSSAAEEQTKILSNKSREFYLRDIPMTDSMIEISNGRIIEGLYNAGTIYKNELHDYPEAVETYRELIDRFPGNEYTLSTYYNLYSLYNESNDINNANIYKASIIREFPESQPAQILTNPNYISELQAWENEVNGFYQMTYDMYNQGNYEGVIRNCDTAMSRYADEPVIPKFEFLKVLAIGKTQDILVFAQALESLSSNSPDTGIATRSAEILAYIMDTDKETRTETERIEAEEIYKADSSGNFSFGLFYSGAVDINQLKFEFINLNLDLYPNRTFDVVHEDLADNVTAVLVMHLQDMAEAWDYYGQALATDEVFEVLGNSDYRLFIISEGNVSILQESREANIYWLFFQKHYSRDEGD
jgi:tetratricopeptide (TPR) repeat protein